MVRRRHAINPPLNIYKKLALSFIVLTAILLGVIFYYSFSYAYITIFPNAQNIATDFNFIIVQDTKAVNEAEGVFLGKIINQTVEGQKTYNSTGSAAVSKGVVGTVKITSTLSRAQILIATTRLLASDNTLYHIKDRVVVPKTGSIEVTVYPDKPDQALAKAGTKFTIPGLSKDLQQIITGEAVADFNAQTTVKVVSQKDIDDAVAALTNELSQKAIAAEDADKTQLLQKIVLEKSLNHKAGDEAGSFVLNLAVKVDGAVFDDKPVKDFAIHALASMVPEDKKLSQTNGDNLSYELEKIDLKNNSAQVKSNINGKIVISENSPILAKDKLMKLSVSQLQTYLENFSDIQKVEITFFPSWLKKMPSFADHIIIRISQ
ncbi:MAG: hypothetical protein PHC97_02195 [Patescibacteria group bacterium]|nr:hypothetical protein [Patescibacteria group bacterium]